MSTYNEAIANWMLAHGQVVPSYSKVSTSSALALFKERGINVGETGEPDTVNIAIEHEGYGEKPHRADCIVVRITPGGGELWADGIDFFVTRSEFDRYLLGFLASGGGKCWTEADWRQRTY